MIEIKNINDDVLFKSSTAKTIGKAVELAVKAGYSLEGAELVNADLSRRNLAGGNFKNANLQGANLQGASLSYANLEGAYLAEANLKNAYLIGANIKGANLSRANLQNTNVDRSAWPLWCGSKNVKVSMKTVRQLLAHVYVLKCKNKEFKEIKKAIYKHLKPSSHARLLGIIEDDE